MDGVLTVAALHTSRQDSGQASGTSLRLTQYKGVEPGYPLRQPKQVDVPLARNYANAWLGPRAQWLYLLDTDGEVQVIGTNPISAPQSYLSANVLPADTTMTAASPLLGALLSGDR